MRRACISEFPRAKPTVPLALRARAGKTQSPNGAAPLRARHARGLPRTDPPDTATHAPQPHPTQLTTHPLVRALSKHRSRKSDFPTISGRALLGAMPLRWPEVHDARMAVVAELDGRCQCCGMSTALLEPPTVLVFHHFAPRGHGGPATWTPSKVERLHRGPCSVAFLCFRRVMKATIAVCAGCHAKLNVRQRRGRRLPFRITTSTTTGEHKIEYNKISRRSGEKAASQGSAVPEP